MAKFSIWQGSQYVSDTQHSEYARIYLERVFNIPWIWRGSEYAKVIQGSKYATIWLNVSEQDVNMPEYV